MTRPARALIDLDALGHNLRRVRQVAPSPRVIAIVKAEAYGHGLARAAGALDEADALGVASVEEGARLRDAGCRKPILLLEGFFSPDELEPISRLGLDVVLHHRLQLEWLEVASVPKPVRVWVKVDTGMHRLGFPPSEVADAWGRLGRSSNVAGPVRAMTHLACADDRDDPRTHEQVARFAKTLEGIRAETSIANSAGILAWPQTHADWVRPGIMLYGVSPFIEGNGVDEGLEPVMTLSTRLIAVNRCHAGDAVGYGATWRCPEAMSIGVAAAGYGDGYPRHLPNGTPVLVNGRRVPLVGRVSMDMITLDLRTQPDARTGDPVVLWGPDLPVEEIARRAGTIAYELLCGVTSRVPKEFLASQAEAGQGARIAPTGS
jgi:alanine racemase